MPSGLPKSSWSVHLVTTSLRLLLDECLVQPLAEDIKTLGRSLKVEHVNDSLLANIGFADVKLVAYAKKRRQIVVTTEGRLNEKRFSICTHPGIIVIKATKRHAALKSKMFRDLVRSGDRKRCKHAVTYLKLDDTGTRTIATFKFKEPAMAIGVLREYTVDLTSGSVLSDLRHPNREPIV